MIPLTGCKSYLREAQERLKDYLIHRLLKAGYTKLDDGRQLYELTLTELMNEYEEIKNNSKTLANC